MKLYLLRHGKTRGNLEGRYIGRTDESLCREGMEELRENLAIGVYAGMEQVDFLFVSPMKRCVETAEILFPQIMPLTVDGFRETDFGDFEGKNYLELSDDASYQAWIDSDGTMPFPGGESREEFQKRCREGMEQVSEQIWNRKMSKTAETVIAMVVHGGTIMSLLSALGDGGFYDYQCGNGRGYCCEFLLGQEPGKGCLLRILGEI